MIHVADTNGRYHRHELITWWDQQKLGAARVLVVGAGALGNEVVKNLTLVGAGTIEIVDMDDVEHSNLSRCVFFSEDSEGQNKAKVLAEKAALLNPDVTVVAHPYAVQRMGAGYIRGFDVVIGALDNREARLWINQACRKWGIEWIDGAIEGLRGIVRIFGESGPCYACTLSEADYEQLSHRRSCALLAPEEILEGKTPTNATTASIVAGVQTQEAIKVLTGNPEMVGLRGKVWSYTGDSMDVFQSGYAADDYCLAHDRYEEVVEADSAKSVSDLLKQVTYGPDETPIAIDFEEDMISIAPCETCGQGAEETRARSSFEPGEGRCESCQKERVSGTHTSFEPGSEIAQRPLNSLGLGLKDVVTLRTPERRIHFLVKGNQ